MVVQKHRPAPTVDACAIQNVLMHVPPEMKYEIPNIEATLAPASAVRWHLVRDAVRGFRAGRQGRSELRGDPTHQDDSHSIIACGAQILRYQLGGSRYRTLLPGRSLQCG